MQTGYYLQYQCTECGAKYGRQPDYCHCCRSTNIIPIKPEYQSLIHGN